jgi:hypothetical protein
MVPRLPPEVGEVAQAAENILPAGSRIRAQALE